jgi:predicted RNA binding protein YcfA (HicA-like mRNA interferase family)
VKVKEIIRLLLDDGWYLAAQKGSHKQYKHLTKKGRVTIPDHGKNKEVAKGTENSILKQAGLK